MDTKKEEESNEGGWWGWLSNAASQVVEVISNDLEEFSTRISDDTLEVIEAVNLFRKEKDSESENSSTEQSIAEPIESESPSSSSSSTVLIADTLKDIS